MNMPGRWRTASRPSRTLMSCAPYCPAGFTVSVMSAFCSMGPSPLPGPPTSVVRPWPPLELQNALERRDPARGVLRPEPPQNFLLPEGLHLLPEGRGLEAHGQLSALPETQRPRAPGHLRPHRPRPRLGQLQLLATLRPRRRLDDLGHQLADGLRPLGLLRPSHR